MIIIVSVHQISAFVHCYVFWDVSRFSLNGLDLYFLQGVQLQGFVLTTYPDFRITQIGHIV